MFSHKFVPLHQHSYVSLQRSVFNTIEETIRKLAWRVFFQKNTKEENSTLPEWGHIRGKSWPEDKENNQIVWNTIQGHIKEKTDRELKQKYHLFKKKRYNHIIPKAKYFTTFKENNTHLIFVMADKNQGIFAISKEQIKQLEEKEVTTYRKITKDEADKRIQEIHNRILKRLKETGEKEMRSFVKKFANQLTEAKRPIIGKLKFLVKVLKIKKELPQNRDLSGYGELPYRPILPYCNCIFYAASKIVAVILNKWLQLFPWVLKDTTEFLEWYKKTIKKRQEQGLPTKTITCDATNLFGSIPPKESIKIIYEMATSEEFPIANYMKKEYPTYHRTQIHLEIMQMVLENTFLYVGENLYEQTDGEPMGAPEVPPVANLTLAFFEWKQLRENTTDTMARYVDDVVTFDILPISYPPYVKWNYDFSPENFLDVHFEKDFETSVHIKKYASEPPNAHSRIPFSMKKNYFVTQLHRATRICSKPEYFEVFKRHLFEASLRNDYKEDTFTELFQKSYDTWKKEQTKKKNKTELKDTVVIIKKHHSSINVNIQKHVEEVIEEIPQEHRLNTERKIKFVTAKRLDQNMGKLLTKEKEK